MTSTRGTLTRRRIAASGLEVVDRSGPEGLSMRALAARLGVSPMALYNHVADRQQLLDDIAELVLTEVRIPTSGSWRERLRCIVIELRDCYLRHPGAMPLVLSASRPSTALLTPMEASLAALEEAGLARDEALEVWVTLAALASGYATYQLGGHLRGTNPGAVDPHTLPRVADAADTYLDWDAAFQRALDRHVAGLGDG